MDEAAPLRQRNGPEARDARERGDPAHFRAVDGPWWRAIAPGIALGGALGGRREPPGNGVEEEARAREARRAALDQAVNTGRVGITSGDPAR